MNESSLAAKRRSRRVPEEARKRNTLSCDWCRKRRCKCVPSQSGKGCLPCEKNNQPCSYTSPRKTRFYGSVDELSDRYRCLEAIVKGAFPNEETATAAELYELGIKKGYRMPDLSDNDRPAVKIEELVRVPSGSVPPPLSQQQSRDSSTTATGSTSPHPHNIHNDNININRSSSSSSIANIINNPPPLPPPHSHPHPHPATALTTTDRHHAARGSSQERHTQEGWRPRTRASSDEPRDSLIRDNQGNSHFIGCSGTLSFLSQLRRLVDTSAPSQEAQVAAKSKFTQDNTAQALEADDDPPAALEKDDNPDACPPSSPPPPRDPMAMVVDRVPPSRGLPTHQNYPPQQQQAVADSPESMSSATARDFTRLPAEEMDEMLRQLPADDVLEALIASYFKNVHDDFPLFHRATFQEEFEMYIVRRPSRQQHDKAPAPVGQQQPSPTPDWGWIGCLQMVCVFGSISDPKIAVDHAALRRRSVTATRTLLPQFISKCSLTNVRVLMLLSLFLHNNNERNAAWNLVGTSTRLAFALGLHRPEMMASFRPLEREVRKWVFCTLYAFEQFLASSLGRPSGLQEMDVEIVPPREGFLDNGGGTDAKLVALSLRLQGILSRTRLMHLGRRHNSVEDILAALDEWKADIAQNPGYDLPWVKTEGFDEPKTVAFAELKASLAWKTRAQLRAVLLVHINYHYITLVATRGVLLRDISMMRRGETVPYSSASEACVKNACQLAHMVILLDTFDILNGLSGLDVFYGYCAAMVLILRLMRPTPGPAPSPGHRDDNSGIAAQQSEKLVQSSLRSLVAKVQDVINRAEKGGSMRRFARVVDTFFNVIKKPPTARIPSIAAPSSTPSHQGLQRYQGHPQGHYQPPPLPPGQHHMPMPPHQQHPHHQQQMQYYQGQNFGGSGASGPGFGYNPNAPPPEHHGMAAPAPPQFGQGYGGDWFNFLPLSTFGNAGVTEFPFSHENNGDYADMEVILGSFRGHNG